MHHDGHSDVVDPQVRRCQPAPLGVVELRVGHGLGEEPRRPDEDGEVRFGDRPGAGRCFGQDRPQHSASVRPPRLDPVCDVVQSNQPSPHGVDHEGAGWR
jgi:hypothetical protein